MRQGLQRPAVNIDEPRTEAENKTAKNPVQVFCQRRFLRVLDIECLSYLYDQEFGFFEGGV